MFIKYNCTSNKTWIFYKIHCVIKIFFIIDKFKNNKDSKLLIFLLLLYSLQQEQELAYFRLEININN